MNEEIALDPEIGRYIDRLENIRGKVGFYNGRFISRFPKGWFKRAIEYAKHGLTDDKAKRAEDLLRKLKDEALLPSWRHYNDEESWHANVTASAPPFDMRISATPVRDFLTATEVDEEDWKGGQGEDLPIATVKNLLNALKPLLTQSRRLYLIDPYFHPTSNRSKELFISALGMAFGARCVSMTIIRNQKDWMPWAELRSHLQAIMNVPAFRGKELRFCVARDLGTQFVLHDRCIMSEKGGLTLDNGLQTKPSLFTLAYLDRTRHEQRWKRYTERLLPFDLIVDETVRSAAT